jgi:deoxycytidylate deaminase
MNAILFAKRDLQGAKLYCTYACCENCLKFIIQAGIREVIYEKSVVESYTNHKKNSMQHPEAAEAATRLIQASASLGFQMKNINGTPYLEELRGGVENIPDFRGK